MIPGKVGREIYAGQALLRIHAEPVAKGAVPAPFANGTVDARQLRIGHHPHAQPVAIAPLGIPVISLALLRRQMVRGHQIHRLSAQDPDAVQRSAVQQHLREAGIIRNGGEQPAASAFKLGLPGRVLPVGRLHPFVDLVKPGDSALLFRRNKEAGILHAQRIKNMLLQIFAERFPAQHLDHRAEDIDRESIHPPFTGLKGQGQPADPIRISHQAREGIP